MSGLLWQVWWITMGVLMLINSLLLFKFNSPISFALILLTQSILSSVMLGLNFSSWYFFFLMLIFLGGVMILLLFMVSMCPNKKLELTKRLPMYCISMMIMGLTLDDKSINNISNVKTSVSFFLYQGHTASVFILLMLSLIICMLSVISVSKLREGPLAARL